MTTAVKKFLLSYESLTEIEKRELVYEIIRRSLELELPPLSDDQLVFTAEQLFLELDKREFTHESPQTW